MLLTRRLDLLPADLQDVRGPHRYTRSLFVDANGDRSPDLVLGAENNTTDSRVLLNDGSGHFHDASASLPPKPFGPTSGGGSFSPEAAPTASTAESGS